LKIISDINCIISAWTSCAQSFLLRVSQRTSCYDFPSSPENLMRVLLTALLSLAPFSILAQQTPPAVPPTQAAPPATTTAPVEPGKAADSKPPQKKEVPPDAPVITLSGTCPNPAPASQSGDACKTVVTRAEFEKIVNALAPEAPESARRQIAETYAQALIVNNEAIKEGAQNDPAAEEVLKYARMRAMAQLLARHVQQSALKVSDADIKKYFDTNKSKFEEAVLTRIVLPKRTGTKKVPVNAAAEKAYAERIRRRLIAGEKPATLQAEVFKRAGLSTPPPPTDLGARRRNALPPTQAQVFDLKPGEVSPVIADQTGSFIYKVEARTTPELDPTISEEIRKTIASERLQSEAKRIGESAVPTLNPDYFGAAPAQPPLPGITVPAQQEPPSK
jgi:hypothetical protein